MHDIVSVVHNQVVEDAPPQLQELQRWRHTGDSKSSPTPPPPIVRWGVSVKGFVKGHMWFYGFELIGEGWLGLAWHKTRSNRIGSSYPTRTYVRVVRGSSFDATPAISSDRPKARHHLRSEWTGWGWGSWVDDGGAGQFGFDVGPHPKCAHPRNIPSHSFNPLRPPAAGPSRHADGRRHRPTTTTDRPSDRPWWRAIESIGRSRPRTQTPPGRPIQQTVGPSTTRPH